jgi:hypothetical protein
MFSPHLCTDTPLIPGNFFIPSGVRDCIKVRACMKSMSSRRKRRISRLWTPSHMVLLGFLSNMKGRRTLPTQPPLQELEQTMIGLDLRNRAPHSPHPLNTNPHLVSNVSKGVCPDLKPRFLTGRVSIFFF